MTGSGRVRGMPALRRHHRFTEDEYLRYEAGRPTKHEFFDGHILAMAGGTPRHNRLASQVGSVLHARLRGGPCWSASSDQRIRTGDPLNTYADVSVFCGRIELHPGTIDTATNPVVLVEVLSPGTREYDLGDKRKRYEAIPTVGHIVYLETETAKVIVVSRGSEVTFEGLDAVATLEAIGVELPLAELYEGIVGPDGPLPV